MDSETETRHRHAVTRWWANNIGAALVAGGIVGIIASLIGVHYDLPSVAVMVPALVVGVAGAVLLSATPPAPPRG